jgi:hypothetical protein
MICLIKELRLCFKNNRGTYLIGDVFISYDFFSLGATAP